MSPQNMNVRVAFAHVFTNKYPYFWMKIIHKLLYNYIQYYIYNS